MQNGSRCKRFELGGQEWSTQIADVRATTWIVCICLEYAQKPCIYAMIIVFIVFNAFTSCENSLILQSLWGYRYYFRLSKLAISASVDVLIADFDPKAKLAVDAAMCLPFLMKVSH